MGKAWGRGLGGPGGKRHSYDRERVKAAVWVMPNLEAVRGFETIEAVREGVDKGHEVLRVCSEAMGEKLRI